MSSDLPLRGVRVLDLTRLLPGAFCTMLLADLGADVIKVEAPGVGDYMRMDWSQFEAVNRNKRSIELDLKSDRGREVLLRLVDTARVLIEGNRPGVMQRLGIGWEVLHERNPKLVMCSITGYGQDGPFAPRAGHDLNYMAVAGALGLNGERDGPPVPLSVQVADIGGGGLQPAVEILAALVAVQRGDQGRWIDVSMTDGAAGFLALAFASRAAGERVARGDGRLTGRYPCYRVYQCADGRHYSVAALEPKFWKTLCDAIGRSDLVEARLAEDEQAHRSMEEVFRSRSRDEWEKTLSGLDVCCEPVLDLDEAAAHPQIKARKLLDAGGQAPALGEHTDPILRELGL
ncbi:MAG TPA: CaiB/BaiF CoA-transferase family protein [Candidatus Dormibacteraeota bacterium]|nr:CaiB/BaiF CoA-transferase family protein [Candidatus Dormibacteraeota bacterium]